VRSFHSQIPVVSRSRSADRHAPFALSTAEGVFEVRSNFSAKLSVPEILQLSSDSHSIRILSKSTCPSAVQTGRSRAGWDVWRIVTWEPDFTGNRAEKLRKWAESHFRNAPRGSEAMGAAKHGAMKKLRMISWKFCRG